MFSAHLSTDREVGLGRIWSNNQVPDLYSSTIFHLLKLLSMKKKKKKIHSFSKQLSGRGLRPELSLSPENSPCPSSPRPGWRPGAVLDEESCQFPSLGSSLLSKARGQLGADINTGGLEAWEGDSILKGLGVQTAGKPY